MWIARDENGELWVFSEKPSKVGSMWKSCCGDCRILINNWFPEVQWPDPEPRELVLKPINDKLKEK